MGRGACVLGQLILQLLLLLHVLKGATGSPVAVICPVTEAWDTVDVTNNDTSDILTTMTISNAAYIWTNYTAGQPFILCGNPSSRVPLTGSSCLYEGANNLTSVCLQDNVLQTAVNGHMSTLELPLTAQVVPCNSTLYSFLATWSFQGKAQGQVAVAKTGCVAVSGADPTWFTRGLNASYNLSPSYASVSGFPSSRLTGNASTGNTGDQPTCATEDSGYTSSLTAQYFPAQFTAGQAALPLTFGTANLTRCSCPDQSAAGQAWDGLPSNYSSNFGARYSGQFLVSDPDGASNDTADWRLVCLQHNDAAQLMVDSMLVINMSASTDLGAGYLQICRALQLTPGWHVVSITYGTGADLQFSVLRFFLLNAEGVDTDEGKESIAWENGGILCPLGSNDNQSCSSPIDCCNLRTSYGCGSNLLSAGGPLPVNSDPFTTPKSTAVQYVLPPYSSIASLAGIRFPTTPASPQPPAIPAVAAPSLAPEQIVAPQSSPGPSAQPVLAPAAQAPPAPQLPLVAVNPLPLQPNLTARAPVQLSLPASPPIPSGICVLASEPCYLLRAGTGVHMRNLTLQCSTGIDPASSPAVDIVHESGNAVGWVEATPVGSYNGTAGFLFRLAIDTSNLAPGKQQVMLQASGKDSNAQDISASFEVLLILSSLSQSTFSSVLLSQQGTRASVAASTSIDLPLQTVAVTTHMTLSSSEGQQSFVYQSDPSQSNTTPLTHSLSKVITLPSPYRVAEPGLLLETLHEVSLPSGGPSAFVCGTISSVVATTANPQPMCEMTAANMAYRGDQGLATSGTEALILLYCNTVIHPCSDCFTIQGPSTSSAQLLQDSQSGTTHGSRFSLHLQWQSGYLGNVSVIVDQTRCQIPGSPQLQFLVDNTIPIQSAAYEVMDYASSGYAKLQ